MNKYIIGSLCALIAALSALVCTYIFTFNEGFSANPEDWAHFGTYIGGVATPLALMATLVALLQSDMHRKAEVNRYINETACKDIKIQIERLESDLKSELDRIKFSIISDGNTHSHSCTDALLRISFLEWEKAIPSSTEIMEKLDSNPTGLPRHDESILAFEAFGMCTALLNRIRKYAIEYTKLSGNNAEFFYLHNKYRIGLERLAARGYKVDQWEEFD